MVKVHIVTECGSGIGYGHLNRCLSLCQAFSIRNISPYLVVNGDIDIRNHRDAANIAAFNWLQDRGTLLDQIKGSDIVIIDSYNADQQLCQLISQRGRVTVYIDDFVRIDYPSGIVLNGSAGAPSLRYPERQDITYLLGPKYQALRKEFWQVPDNRLNEEVRSAMITFGGQDARGLIPGVLTLLNKTYPDLTKHIIVGKDVDCFNKIRHLCDEKTRVKYDLDAQEMKAVMLESDFAITSGGQTLYELARLGVPAIVVATAANQMTNIQGLLEASAIAYAGSWDDERLIDRIRSLIGKIFDYQTRTKMQSAGKGLIDGTGSLAVVDFLLAAIE